ncbi:MAG: hypothetical protein HFJ80_06350 [Clostridiales bacterium]|nr:hypothetical protein [Clostridiales bacterium]
MLYRTDSRPVLDSRCDRKSAESYSYAARYEARFAKLLMAQNEDGGQAQEVAVNPEKFMAVVQKCTGFEELPLRSPAGIRGEDRGV